MVRTKGDMKGPTKDELRRQIAEKDAENAAAYERGAREFAEWLDTEIRASKSFVPVVDTIARFLASRGTAAEKKEG